MNTDATRPLPPHVHALVALCVLNHVALSGSRVALALQALRLGVPSVGLALMLAPFALASTLAALPLGRWVDRVGARVPALAGMATTTIGLAAAAWRPQVAVLTLAAALVGLGYTASLIALQGELARDRDERTRQSGFAGFAIGTAASGGFGPFLAGQCIARTGVQAAFGALALVSFAAWCGGMANSRRLIATRTAAPGARAALFSRATFAGLGGLRRLMLADLLMAFAWNANGFVAPLVGQRHGWPADTVGNLLGCFGAAVMLVRALPDSLRARGGDWRVIARALAISGGALALLPLASGALGPYVFEALFGGGLGCALPSVLALIEQRTPPGRRAEVLGLRQAVLGLGAATLPTALGALVAATGLVGALLGLGGALLAAGATIAPRGNAQSAGIVARIRASRSATPPGTS
ncbi:MFS transporter [Scleromatobacter humisilvae]|uniref:MFS transporter n=1 Tax=Scleromatobacter humisilvae TaxID=2897159 RepID=A0A9X1YHR4_9BURK|nr:MFS transporter [Scleromatobacter humisilvae]MCK9686724.1 MFS transporter [Scleromatobacter humisilvae]